MEIKTKITLELTHRGRVAPICVGNLAIICSDNGLSSGRCQATIWTNAVILSIGPWGTNFSEILNENITFSFKKIRLKVSPAKWRPFCLGFNVSSHKLFTMTVHTWSLLWLAYKWRSKCTSTPCFAHAAYVLAMKSQWITQCIMGFGNCDASTCKMVHYSLNNNFIQCDIQSRLCK